MAAVPRCASHDGREVVHGRWPSPLSAAEAAQGTPRLSGPVLGERPDGEVVVWFAQLVDGRNRVVRCDRLGARELRQVGSARSRLNEYGGGAFWVGGEVLYWVEDDDQRVHRLDPESGLVDVLTPEPPLPRAWRYAAGVVVPADSFTGGQWIVCERQRLCDEAGVPFAEAVNDLVAVDAGAPVGEPEAPVVLVSGADFVAAPTLSADGRWLAWLRWDHPDMPWDAAELWVGRLEVAGRPEVVDARRVAGGRADGAAVALGRAVSVCLPVWSPAGVLHFCDDRDDRWVLRAAPEAGLPGEAGCEGMPAVWDGGGEVGEPRWVAGGGRAGFLDDGRLVLAETVDGLDTLRVLDPAGTELPSPLEATWLESVACRGTVAAMLVGRPDRVTTVVRMSSDPSGSWRVEELRPSNPVLAERSISAPEPFTFPTTGGEAAHGLFFPPRLEGVCGPAGELPPLVVRIHGGPTAHAVAELNSSVQFWTTRGFAVAEVNYRGSTGFGRRYRDLLAGGWGVVEVQDCIAAARHLAAAGRVDPARCVIRGGSAGGFTALEAVCAPPAEDGFRFAAATSLYGVTDLMAMAADTHKFEARYLDGLIGPLPEAEAVYRERSPLHHAGRIAAPVLLLQGLEDMVVPPEQAEVLVAAMEANGIDFEYRAYEGEAHGFRLVSTVVDALTVEADFYRRVLAIGSPPPA